MLNNKTCSKKSSAENDSEDTEMEDGTREKEIKGWQGTSKEWVRRVEEAYWQGSRVAHIPVAIAANGAGGVASDSGASSPTLVGSGANTPLSSSNAKSIRVEDHQRLLEALAVSQDSKQHQQQRAQAVSLRSDDKVGADSMAYADVLANLVVKELCHLAAEGADAAALDKARVTFSEHSIEPCRTRRSTGSPFSGRRSLTAIEVLLRPTASTFVLR